MIESCLRRIHFVLYDLRVSSEKSRLVRLTLKIKVSSPFRVEESRNKSIGSFFQTQKISIAVGSFAQTCSPPAHLHEAKLFLIKHGD